MTELAGAASANPVIGPNKPGTIGRDRARPARTPRSRARRSWWDLGRDERRACKGLRRPQARNGRHPRGAHNPLPRASRGIQGPAGDPVHDTATNELSGKIMRRLLTDIDDGTRTTASDLTPAAT